MTFSGDNPTDSASKPQDFLTLTGKRIVLIVTGGIAAYKSCELARLIRRAGGEVRVVLTAHAREFVGATTFATLSGHPALTDMFPDPAPGDPVHLTPAHWGDLLIVAPATANFLAKMTQGIADDLASTVALSFAGRTLVAPAMNPLMWDNPAVQDNIAHLNKWGTHFIGPETGAMGGVHENPGRGRMSEPVEILAAIEELLVEKTAWAGRIVLVTTGPTREALDPVRFVSNRSSGRMGDAVARQARLRGAEVVLARGKGSTGAPPHGVRVIPVESAAEMAAVVKAEFPACDLLVMAAAVADWTIVNPATTKLKKKTGAPIIEWAATEDVLAWAGQNRTKQVVAGFALETADHLAGAREKLTRKNIDLIALNDPTQPDSAFGGDAVRLTILTRDGAEHNLPWQSKTAAADGLLQIASQFLPD